jgi:chemotaxis protein CheX
MAQSFRQSSGLISRPENLDASVDEVFRLMLGVECESAGDAASAPSATDEESVTAVVGFGGMLSGACVFRCSRTSAMKTATRMTGVAFGSVDDTVKDGIGEICNMLAGAWKGSVPGLAANCWLSVPAIITGSNYRIHVQAPEFQLQRTYRFEDVSFSVTIICDGVQ